MISKLSILHPELTVGQLNDLSEWLSTKGKPSLLERIQAYLEKYGSATLKELKDRLRLPSKEIICSLNKMVDHGVIERYSAGEFKTKYRMKK